MEERSNRQLIIPAPQSSLKYLERRYTRFPSRQNPTYKRQKIFMDIGSLKGKTTRRNTLYVEDDRSFVMSPNVINNYILITIGADIMFINKITFLMTIS